MNLLIRLLTLDVDESWYGQQYLKKHCVKQTTLSFKNKPAFTLLKTCFPSYNITLSDLSLEHPSLLINAF